MTSSGLIELLFEPGVVIINSRSGTAAHDEYHAAHFASALLVDLKKQLSREFIDAADCH